MDGPGHDSSRDAYRASQLSIPEIRLAADEVIHDSFSKVLAERILGECNRTETSTSPVSPRVIAKP